MILETLKSQDEICNVLSDPIPSATQIVQDGEKIVLHCTKTVWPFKIAQHLVKDQLHQAIWLT